MAAGDWLQPEWRGRPPALHAQRVDQADGHATILLHIDTRTFEADEEEDDLIESYTPRFRR